MTEQRTISPSEDPVCGMTVDTAEARANGLTLTHDGTENAFCGKGCLLEFRDDPQKYLDPGYPPSMSWAHRPRLVLGNRRLGLPGAVPGNS